MTSEVYLVAVLLVVTLTGVQVLLGSGAITAALALTASLACEVGYLRSQAHGSQRMVAWA